MMIADWARIRRPARAYPAIDEQTRTISTVVAVSSALFTNPVPKWPYSQASAKLLQAGEVGSDSGFCTTWVESFRLFSPTSSRGNNAVTVKPARMRWLTAPRPRQVWVANDQDSFRLSQTKTNELSRPNPLITNPTAAALPNWNAENAAV